MRRAELSWQDSYQEPNFFSKFLQLGLKMVLTSEQDGIFDRSNNKHPQVIAELRDVMFSVVFIL